MASHRFRRERIYPILLLPILLTFLCLADGCVRPPDPPSAFLSGFSGVATLKKTTGFGELGPVSGGGSGAGKEMAADVKLAAGTSEAAFIKALKSQLEGEVVGTGGRLLNKSGEQGVDKGLWGVHFEYTANGRSGIVRVWLVTSSQAVIGGHYLTISVDEH